MIRIVFVIQLLVQQDLGILSNFLQGSVAGAVVYNDRLTPEAQDIRLQADCVAEAVLGLDVQNGGIY